MSSLFKKSLVAASVSGVFLALTGVSQSAFAHGNLLPAIKVGGGWVSLVSYINTQASAGGGVFVHATHQSKNLANLTDACVHVDGRSTTTQNDLTSTVLSTPGGAVGTVFPTGDTVGGAIINPGLLSVPTSEGFLVLENYDGAGTLGADGTLTSDAIVFNLTSGFLYSTRALSVTHTTASPSGTVTGQAPACGNCNFLIGNVGAGFGNTTAGNLTRFGFLPPSAPASTSAYVIPLNRGTNLAGAGAEDPLSTNLVAAGYNSTARFEARMDAAQGYAQGLYDRLEGSRSLSVTNNVTCVGQLSPQQITGSTIPSFIANGGWFNLSARALQNGSGQNSSDAAMTFKIEYAPGYGLAIQPLNQQWYAK